MMERERVTILGLKSEIEIEAMTYLLYKCGIKLFNHS